jgi:hypothetical protein
MKTINVTKKLQTKFAADHRPIINKQAGVSHFKKTDVITDRVVGKHASQRPFFFSKVKIMLLKTPWEKRTSIKEHKEPRVVGERTYRFTSAY